MTFLFFCKMKKILLEKFVYSFTIISPNFGQMARHWNFFSFLIIACNWMSNGCLINIFSQNLFTIFRLINLVQKHRFSNMVFFQLRTKRWLIERALFLQQIYQMKTRSNTLSGNILSFHLRGCTLNWMRCLKS